MWKSATQQKEDEFQVKSFGMVCSDKGTPISRKLAASWAHMCMDEVRVFEEPAVTPCCDHLQRPCQILTAVLQA